MKGQNIFKKRQAHTHTETLIYLKTYIKAQTFRACLTLNVKDHGFNLGPIKIAFKIGIWWFSNKLAALRKQSYGSLTCDSR
jgi:hypothetical protein